MSKFWGHLPLNAEDPINLEETHGLKSLTIVQSCESFVYHLEGSLFHHMHTCVFMGVGPGKIQDVCDLHRISMLTKHENNSKQNH